VHRSADPAASSTEVTVALTVDQLDQRILAEHDAARTAELGGDLHIAERHRKNADRMLDMRPRLAEYEGSVAEVPC
jgi:hypothetical protein